MKLGLEVMNDSIDEFFEADRAEILRTAIQGRSPDEREIVILDAVKSAIKEARGIPLFFRFLSDRNRISHHLVFASKSRKAVNQMKRILNFASSSVVDGVGSGGHDPRAAEKTGSLFDGLFEVEEYLLSTYAGRRIRFEELISEESETRFTEGSFRDALLKLESEGRLVIDPPAESRRYQPGRTKRTLPKEAHIEFRGPNTDGD
jgi:hypothetical protein